MVEGLIDRDGRRRLVVDGGSVKGCQWLLNRWCYLYSLGNYYGCFGRQVNVELEGLGQKISFKYLKKLTLKEYFG